MHILRPKVGGAQFMICGICRKKTQLILKEKFGVFSLWECNDCQGQFWVPMKNPGAEWYEKDERYSFRNKNPLKKPEINHREFLRDLPTPGGKLLDIGMGTGNFLADAAAKGYNEYGIDFDADAIETAKQVFNLKNVYPLNVEGAIKKFGSDYFDAITMFEVLEHLENPSESIEKIKILLKTGGYLGLSVPYRGSWNGFKTHDKPPRHLTRWNKESMKNFLNAHQFSVIRIKIIPVPFSYLITKYHFWYKGIFSFGIVEKLTVSTKKEGGGESTSKKQYWKINLLQKLARAKDYLLFSLPAAFLYLRLRLRGELGFNLYVLANLN